MRRGPGLLLPVMLVAACLAPAASAEEDDSTASLSARLSDLEGQVARVNELEAELTAVRQQLRGGLAAPSHDDAGNCCQPTCCEPSCCEPACCCEPCCCLPCCQMGWYGGAELVWAQPSLHVIGLEYDFEPTPRIWLGYNGCGLGVRGHWWRFEGDGNPVADVNTIDLGGGVIATNGNFTQESLELELADLEVTKMFSACGSTIVVAGGGRYVRYDRRQTAQLIAAVNGVPTQVVLIDESERLQAFGPTLAAEIVTPVTCQWSLYAGFRATIAFGDQDLTETAQIFPLGLETVDALSRNDRIQIIEIELALQYTVGRWFARGGWQAQHWDEPSIFSLGVQGFAAAVGANF
jgi:hypothetical protein